MACGAGETGVIEVRTGIGMASLLALRDDWAAITDTLPGAGFHHSWGWHFSYLRNLEPDPDAVHFFSFFRGGKPIAIVPLRRARRRVATGASLSLWELPSHPHMNLCDCVIASHEDGAAVMRSLMEALANRDDMPWDALYLPNLPDGALMLKALRAGTPPRGALAHSGRSMYFSCSDPAAAMHGCSRDFRRNLRRQRNRLEHWGRVESVFVREPGQLAEAFAAFLRIEASGWKGEHGCGSAIVLHPELVRFYQDLIAWFARHERCVIGLLKLDGVPIAAQFGIVAADTLHLLKIAYDEAYRNFGPGNQLLHDAIRHCCASDSLARLSLVTAPAWAADRWSPRAHDLWDVHVFSSSLRGISAYGAARFRSAVGAMARAEIGAVGG